MTKVLEGWVDNGKGAPLPNISAIVTRITDGGIVTSGLTGPDGRWHFSGLSESEEYFVNLADGAGNAIVRAPWSGELREAYIRDRLALPNTGLAVLPGGANTTVGGLPLRLDPNPANVLTWGPAGLYTAGSVGLTQALADTLYEPLDSAYTKSESDLRYEPFDSAYTKAESDARYTQGGITQAAADLRYEPLDTMYTKAESDARYPLKTDLDPYPTYLTQTEGDARYTQGGITQAFADSTYVNTVGDLMTGTLMIWGAGAPTLTAFQIGTAGDANWALNIQKRGRIEWSDRTAAADAYLERTAVGVLSITGKPVTISPDAANIVEWRANGFYAAAGAVSDIWVDVLGDTMTGNLNMAANILPTTTNARDLGSTTLRWRKVWATDADFTNAPTVGGLALLTSTTADALFLTPAEGNAAYATAAHNHDATYVKLVGGSVMTGLLGPTTTNVNDLGTTALRWRKLWAVDGEFTNVPTVGGVALLTQAAADLRYEPLDSMYTKAEDDARFVNLAGGSVMTGLLGPTTTNTRDLGTSALRWRKLWGVDADLSGALTVTTGPLTVSAGGIAVTGASTFSVAPTVGGSSLLTATAGDTAYVNVGGDTMTGPLSVLLTTGTVVGTLRNGNADDNVQLRFRGNVAAVDQWAIGNNITGGSGRNFDIYDLVSGASRLRVSGTTGVVDFPTGVSVTSRPVIMAGCRAYHNATQAITTSTGTALAFNSERYDSDAFHDLVTNNSRLTVPAGMAGKYMIWANLVWALVADATYRAVSLRLNGATYIGRSSQMNTNSATFDLTQNVSTIYDLAVGDYVEVVVRQDRGSNLDVAVSANFSPEFGMQRIG